jgi:hypothetical protein
MSYLNFRRFALAAIALAASAGVTYAGSKDVVAKANMRNDVAAFAFHTVQTCKSAGVIDFKVSRQGAHGRVEIEKRVVVLQPGSVCAGSKVKAAWIVYTPNRGYRGPDTFEIASPVTGDEVSTYYETTTYNVTVR